ncbi:MAG TPA: aspartate aminotransferase family protein, partial [Rickettsiales bacterium]|nr:aspartate aminotransferase family protein [Rickettsiales bacterium]
MTISDKLLPVHKRFDISFDKGRGVYLFSGRKKYLDFGAGIAVNALGHCHPKLVKALTKQAKKLWHVSNIYAGNELNIYAEKLVASSFADYVFFCNSGAEAIECTIKMIRRHFYVKNQPQKNRIITFTGAFHGRTIATISAAGKQRYIEGFEPKLEGFDNVEFGNITAVKNAITANTAGILIEPIQGEEGIRVISKKFLQDLRKLCDENDILLAFDEVQCGMGRVGNLHAYEYFEVKPDIISLAKAIGGGFPLGACLATKDAARGMSAGVHGTTYGGNPLAMATANALLDIMLEKNFFKNLHEVALELKNTLEEIKNKNPDIIQEIRGIGMMLGIKFYDKIEN